MKDICIEHIQNNKYQLQTNNLKATPARLEILDILEHAQKPLNIDEVAKLMKNKKADFSTVFRNIESLKQLNLVRQVSLNTPQSYYELTQKPHHHHLVCESCGMVKDVFNCEKINLSPAVVKRNGFAKLNYHSLEFFGLCNKCIS
jgi:Fe2+ or Zn2+ uptake regulation protein